MKKQKNIIIMTVALFITFFTVSIFTFIQSNKWIKDGFLSAEGNAAQNFAVLTASNLHLSNEDVIKLKQLSYEELQISKENQDFYKMLSNESFSNNVNYAYVMIKLPSDEVKYKVDEKTKDFYDAPVGTDLDIMWLLDIDTSNNTSFYDSLEENNLTDIDRYSYYIPEDDFIFGSTPSYIYNSSEWGDHICGYSPLYSTEGTYIGAVGVELETADFESYTSKAMWAMGILLAVVSITLLGSFIIIYRKYSKIQFEKIHTDALTGIYNRSYYNNRFIKVMNSSRPKGTGFVLLIADIDFFKKVNDTFGHEIGDEVIIEIADLMIKSFGRKNVARFGGEEFVAGFFAKDMDEALKQFALFKSSIINHKFSTLELDITVSVGSSFTKEPRINGWLTSTMLKEADNNLYYIKEHGRNDYKLTEHYHNKK